MRAGLRVRSHPATQLTVLHLHRDFAPVADDEADLDLLDLPALRLPSPLRDAANMKLSAESRRNNQTITIDMSVPCWIEIWAGHKGSRIPTSPCFAAATDEMRPNKGLPLALIRSVISREELCLRLRLVSTGDQCLLEDTRVGYRIVLLIYPLFPFPLHGLPLFPFIPPSFPAIVPVTIVVP